MNKIIMNDGNIIICNILSETDTSYFVDSFGEVPIDIKKEEIKKLTRVEE